MVIGDKNVMQFNKSIDMVLNKRSMIEKIENQAKKLLFVNRSAVMFRV